MKNRFFVVALGVLVSWGCMPRTNKEVPTDNSVDIMNTVTIPAIDLNGELDRQVVVDREQGQYLGHVSTILLEDGKTIYASYPKGHGRGPVILKRSDDGGLSWSERLPVPESWATSKETPTLKRVVDADGNRRIIMWSGLYPVRISVSEDDGETWSELKPVGDWGGITVMGFTEALNTKGHYMAMFHDDGRFIKGGDQEFWGSPAGVKSDSMMLYSTFSYDGGLTWSDPRNVYEDSTVLLCEPGVIRSPDGKQIAVLLRENKRKKNSHIIFSDDEGKTWTKPRELPLSLTGDRHTARYTPDGRIFISFRIISPDNKTDNRPFETDWGGWVGTYDDLVHGREGQYVVRLKENHISKDGWEYDTAYPGVEVLPDGTIVATTYGHWDAGERPYILCVRFKLEEIDLLNKKKTVNP
ncbi:sialidase family protein [Reichenbachiella sp. MALMAid0571]|uniref:sialidase family protein n=1 Tax=Reichenbachiella sp. MALMAid0571 TaxID=3143939 RepID=UPI0032DE4C13